MRRKLTALFATATLFGGGALAGQDIIKQTQIDALPQDQKLKVTTDRILDARRSDSEVAYSWKTGEAVSSEPLADRAAQKLGARVTGERIEQRTGNARVFETDAPGVTIHVFIADKPQFYKEADGTWTTIDYATTTPEAFDLQAQPTILQKLFGAIRVAAQTFNPSFDGMIYASGIASWAGAHDASAGTSKSDSVASDNIAAEFVAGTYWIQRGFFLYDTSSLTDSDTVTAAVLSLHGDTADTVGNADSVSMNIVASTPASDTTLSTDDFDQVGGTSFGAVTLASWTRVDYNDFTLDANGRAAVNKTGISKFAARLSNDVSNTSPSGANHAFVDHSETAGTGSDPKLVVTAVAASAPAAEPIHRDLNNGRIILNNGRMIVNQQ